MEGSHSVSTGLSRQDNSWTCHRCGWVYPNAHPSAKHRRNHKKQCERIKGFELKSEVHKGGSSDEASSGDDSQAQTGSGAPAVEHPNAPQSRDLPVTELNVPDKGNSNTPFAQGISASVDHKPEVADNVSTRDTIKTMSPNPEPNMISLDPEEQKTMYETVVDRVEEPTCILPGLYTDEAKESVKANKCEDPPLDHTTSKPLRSVEEQNKFCASEDDGMEAGAHDFDSDQPSSSDRNGAKSQGLPPKDAESITSLGESSKTSQDETIVTLTPCLDKGEIAAQKSQGSDSDHLKARERLLISKEHGLYQQCASQDDDSWTCHCCGWVYPNSHPSAKHRRKHKKQCGKIKGFEQCTETHHGGSSDEVSSDEDVDVRKEHVPHQPLPLLGTQEKANETVATESLPPIVDHPTAFVKGDGLTENVSSSSQPEERSAQVNAFDREKTPNVKDTATPDTVTLPVPDLSKNMPSLDQQNLPLGDNKDDVLDEPDTSITKESPKDLHLTEEILSSQGNVQESFEDSETQVNADPSLPKSVDSLTSECHGNLEKDTDVEPGSTLLSLASKGDTNNKQGSTNESAEQPAGLSGECASYVASIPSVSDFKPSDTYPPAYVDDKGASMHEVVGTSAVDISGMEPRDVGLQNETVEPSAREGLNQNVNLKEEREKPGSIALDSTFNVGVLDDTVVTEPLRKEIGNTLIEVSDDQSEAEAISSEADKATNEKKAIAQNLLPVTVSTTADVTRSAKDANEERKFLTVQASADSVQLAPENESVEGGTDDVFLSHIDKTDETSPVTNMEYPLVIQRASSTKDKTDETCPAPNMEQPLDQQMSVDTAKKDVPREVSTPATTEEAIQKNLQDFASSNVSSVPEGSSLGETGGDTENTNTTICITKYSGLPDIAKEIEVENKVISSITDGEQEKTEESVSLEVTPKPEPKAETPSETGGLGSPDLSNTETYSFARSESGVTARSELGSSSHKLSDSLEIYEDATDTLETSSVCGSVEENEILDEPRQASDRLQEDSKLLEAASLDEGLPRESVTDSKLLDASSLDGVPRERFVNFKFLEAASLDEGVPRESVTSTPEPKHLGTASLDEGVPDESVAVEEKPSVSNGVRLGEASLEERASSLPGTSYGGRNEMEDLKAPSPEAWQEPGPSNVKIEGKKISTSEVTEDSKSGDSHKALRSLMAKEGPGKADTMVETSTPAGDVQSSGKKDGSLASANGTKPKSRSFWRHCICCSPVH